MAACLCAASVCVTACAAPESSTASQALYPAESSRDGLALVEFGPGSLRTSDDQPWGGVASVTYPIVLDTEAGPVELEIDGLDLSGIEYTGDLGWPPDPTDKGAIVMASLVGSDEITYRIYSSVADLLAGPGAMGAEAPSHTDFRAYQFHGYFDNTGTYGDHSLNLERWGAPDSRGPYNTIDLRVRYERGIVGGWVRLHASYEWDDGGRERGRACPWNVAINNAVPGTADSIWTGECRAVESGETGRPVGAWVPFAGGSWTTSSTPESVQVGLSILNWENAEGPYEARWQNVIVRGVPDSRLPWSSGEGTLRAFGTGQSELKSRGEWAEFSYRVMGQGVAGGAGSVLRYRSADFQLTSERTRWVIIDTTEVRFAGEGRVNGARGYRYELRGAIAAGEDPDSLTLQVWSPESPARPYYFAFGSLAQGSIQTRLPEHDGP